MIEEKWTASADVIAPGTIRVTLNERRPLDYSEVISRWCDDDAFRTFFSSLVNDSPFDAFFWETPPVSSLTSRQPFEFVVVESQALGRLCADPVPFQEHFLSNPGQAVHTFPNLGGDAVLVVPGPVGEVSCYPHMARFLRSAPPEQIDRFWQAAGLAMKQRISSNPVWLSTAGMGVSWLHLRLDSRPKYYRHQPYTR